MTRFNHEVDGFRHGKIPAVTQIGPLFTSSPIPPLLPGANSPAEDAAAQIEDLFAMIGHHLTAAGVHWDEVAKIDFFVSDLQHWPLINAAWDQRFPHTTMRPARHIHHEASIPGAAHVVATFLAYRVES